MNILSTGIDISRWQGDFNMNKAVAEGFRFAILKAGGGDDGLYKDSRFEKNYENAKRLGIPVGTYWFSKALSIEDAVEEAEYFYEHCLKGRQFELPVYMDVEHAAQIQLGKEKITGIIHAFCQRLEELGFWVGIYSSRSYFSAYMFDDELQRYAHWVAAWGKSCDYEGDCFGMWQYGGETNLIRSNKVAGVVCDQNYMLIDYPTLIKNAGKNGFGGVVEKYLPQIRDEPAEAPEEPAVPAEPQQPAEVKVDYARSLDEAKAGTYKVNARVGLNLRAGASTNKQILETMPHESLVKCYGYHTGQWLYVISASGAKGFCHCDYLVKV